MMWICMESIKSESKGVVKGVLVVCLWGTGLFRVCKVGLVVYWRYKHTNPYLDLQVISSCETHYDDQGPDWKCENSNEGLVVVRLCIAEFYRV